ncbi:hypothetical protein N181_30655 [Sinorhizobium fredii USDA 205]|uniref:Uncharacterized protein n=1 Tax=Rhizobium fredii TaxID=380 RepID=A0A844A545_RHIFR|nr:hypothetical protein [Sinorhizobium fredii]KSV91845.1 hypothetical protein N181_30655 [Sinorhizobium fredii USDA 205]MQX07627.1 hypothetical protein [Sinorhizobium fredii]GEC35755.1 hypothetical protein EFR01_59260 [Sinorhizobium fredii]GLS07428.1 hypothetical protein GCM10007864_10550 [Sinorhizobium fredii]
MHDLEFSNAKMPWFANGCGPLLEPDVKTASTRVRADNLANAARKGWNNASLSIVSGLKRKFEELRLQLIVGRHRTQLADG